MFVAPEHSDTCSALLHSVSPSGIVETRQSDSLEISLTAYLPDDGQTEHALSRLRESSHLKRAKMTVERIRQSDWVRQWRASQQPMLLARRIHLQPPGQKSKPPPGSIALIIDPGMAFGTGRHETTQLCLWGLVERLRHGMRVLDLGCGSGILALSAAKLGAGQVFALDLDPVAVQCARKNAALNGLSDRVAIICASLSSLLNSPSRFDLAMINITAPIIQQFLREGLKQIFRPGGMAIFSGILAAEMQTLTSDLQKAGFDIIQARALGEWRSLAVRVGL